MRKIIALGILSLGIVFLAGCGQQQNSQTVTDQNTNQQVTQPQDIVYENSMTTFDIKELGITFSIPAQYKDDLAYQEIESGVMALFSKSVMEKESNCDAGSLGWITKSKTLYNDFNSETRAPGIEDFKLGDKYVTIHGPQDMCTNDKELQKAISERIEALKRAGSTVRSTVTDKEDDTSLKSYENKTLNISFSYPQDWGDVSQKKDGTDHIALSVFESSVVFLAADNGGESVARGAYWGDSAELIDSQNYVNNLCDTKGEAQSCEIKTNSSGVQYAKVVEEVFQMGGGTIGTNYYIYNPNSEFRGIILSTDRLREKDVSDLESKLQNLVDSLYFIN